MLLRYHFYQYFVMERENIVLGGYYTVCMTQYFQVTGPTEGKKTTKLEVLSYITRLQNFPIFY